jgi:cobalamin biosynthesis protein CobT
MSEHTDQHRRELSRVVAEVKPSGVELIGVGVCTDAVAKYYPDYVVVNDLNMLPAVLLDKFGALLGLHQSSRRAI